MQAMDDMALLREYAGHDSEAAFETLVSRRIGFVYSAALRQVRDPHLAGEITQAVFIILAQKAGKISDKTILTGWLFKTTRFAALAQIRAKLKRSLRTATIEKEFQMQSEFQSAANDEIWNQMSPLLDEALASLGETDRQAVLLRFFENKSLAEVGNSLGTGEDTARKRVSRALGKLHRYFSKRGVNSTTAIIAGAISANSVQAAPVALAKSVTVMAIAKGAAASISTLTLIKGALKIMAWTKMKIGVFVGVGLLLAAGTTTITIKEIQAHKTYNWQVPRFDSQTFAQIMKNTSPLVQIVPTKFPSPGPFGGDGISFLGVAVSLTNIISFAYTNSTAARTVFEAEIPQGRYDFIANVPASSTEALKQEIKKVFGLAGRLEMRDVDVWALKVRQVNASGLKRAIGNGDRLWIGSGELSCQNQSMTRVASLLEAYFGIPVVDETDVNGRFDIHLHWNEREPQRNPDGLKQALLDQLGLELMPGREPIEMLVVEKVK
jgi:uncharacterized protein (TIGR03435 family)